jgi:hypothetical protein
MNTAELTLRLPEAEALYLKGFAEKYKVPVSELIVYFVEHLRRVERYKHHPDIKMFAGIIPGDFDASASYYEHIEDKHK